MSCSLFNLNLFPVPALLLGLAALNPSEGSAASLQAAWQLYREGHYAQARAEYLSVHREQPGNLDAIHGIIETSTYLHAYRQAVLWCDSLKGKGLAPEAAELKKQWVKTHRSQNRQFGLNAFAGPLLYSHRAIGEGAGRYAYDQGRYGEIEGWFYLNRSQTFSLTVSGFQSRFRSTSRDSLWYGVRYLDTLYASLGQSPLTDKYISGPFTNILGNPDTWYSDYTDTLIGALPSRPQTAEFDTLVSFGQTPYRPEDVRQRQIRLGYTRLFPRMSLGFALTVGQSNLAGQGRFAQGWIKQGVSLAWLDLVMQESLLQLDKAAFIQMSPRLIRGVLGCLFEFNPSWVMRIADDANIDSPKQQLFAESKLYRDHGRWSWSVAGLWGPKAYSTAEEGRSIANLELDHAQTYGLSIGCKPFLAQPLKLYGMYKWEQYSGLSRQLVFIGSAYSW
jgi:hypothetical protein